MRVGRKVLAASLRARNECPKAQFQAVACSFGVPRHEGRCQAFLKKALGAVKIGRDNFQRIAIQAMATPWVPRNPRPIEGPDQVREILELAS